MKTLLYEMEKDIEARERQTTLLKRVVIELRKRADEFETSMLTWIQMYKDIIMSQKGCGISESDWDYFNTQMPNDQAKQLIARLVTRVMLKVSDPYSTEKENEMLIKHLTSILTTTLRNKINAYYLTKREA